MKERLISFETAKLAKEKGFNIKTEASYLDNENVFKPKRHSKLYPTMTCINSVDEPFVSAPTESLFQKWLRDEHKICAYIDWSRLEIVIVEYGKATPLTHLRKDVFDISSDENDWMDYLLKEALNKI